MLLERTISQLDIGMVPREEAQELGQLGYMQWLASLQADSDYLNEAMVAYKAAQPFSKTSPAVAVFCDFLIASTRSPIQPLPLKMPPRKRRGGAKRRRLTS